MVKISVTVVVSLAMLIAMAVAALIAFFPTHEAGLTSVRDSIEVVRKNVLGRVVNGVEQFFKVPGSQIDTIKSNYDIGALDMTNDETVVDMMCSMVRDQREILTGAFVYTRLSVIGCDQRLGPNVAGILHTTNGTGVMPVYGYDLTTMEYTQPKTVLMPLEWDVALLFDYFNLITNSSSRNRWASGEGHATINFAGSTTLNNPTTNALDYRLVLYLYPKQLEPLLQSLGVGANGRVLLADGFNRNVFGTSWGEATETLDPNWQLLPVGHPDRMKLKDVSDMQDSSVKRVVEKLGGSNAFYALTDLSTTMFEGADKVFVDVRTLTDSFQLHVKVLVILRERDYTETIVERQKSTIGAVCGALVGMLLLSVVFAVLLTRPLKHLGFRMYKTASLQDEEEDDSPSLLSEIAGMQEAYVAMKRELNRIKSYLPQSVLEGNDDDDDEEEEEGSRASSGKVSPQSASREPSVRSSRRSRGGMSRHSSSRSSANGAVVGALNTARAVHRRRVAVATFNLVGFHAVSQQGTPAAMTSLQSKYLTICSKNVRDSKGFVDSFQGDHVFASFNAVATVATPAKRALLAAIAAAKELSETPLMPQFTAGVAVSQSAAGNMGNDAMVRFNVVGPACAQSQAMERLARQRLRTITAENTPFLQCADNALIAMTQDVISDVELEIECQYFDIVTMGGKPRLVAFAGNARKMASDEWMYQLDEAAKGDKHQLGNDAMRALLNGEKDEAAKLMEEAGTSATPIPAELAARLKEIGDATDIPAAASKIQFEL